MIITEWGFWIMMALAWIFSMSINYYMDHRKWKKFRKMHFIEMEENVLNMAKASMLGEALKQTNPVVYDQIQMEIMELEAKFHLKMSEGKK